MTRDPSRPYGNSRVTRTRRAIAAAVERAGGAFTVEDLLSELRRSGGPSAVATVYRAVAAMEAAGHLARVGAREGAALYARCADPASHHHHVVCDECGRIAATRCPLDLALPDPEATGGFVVTRHEIALYGLCPECARREG